MRNFWAILTLTLVVGCSGTDGKDGADGRDGEPGRAGPAGRDGADGADGKDGAPGATGKDGAPGMDGAEGAAILKGTGAPAAGLGADGDLYIDTVSRDVYQKAGGAWTVITNLSGGPKGDPGSNGADGSSVRTGSGPPAAGLGAVGDVYIDSATGDLYAKSAGGWTKTGNLAGPAGMDGSDVANTLGGVRWYAFALTAAFVDAPQLVTSETYTAASSKASFTFTGADQQGRLAFQTAGSFVPGGVNLSAFESLDLSATVTGGAVNKLVVVLADGDKKGCQWDVTPAGPVYSIKLTAPTNCYNETVADADFDLGSVTQVEIGIESSGAGARTLTITDIGLVDSR